MIWTLRKSGPCHTFCCSRTWRSKDMWSHLSNSTRSNFVITFHEKIPFRGSILCSYHHGLTCSWPGRIFQIAKVKLGIRYSKLMNSIAIIFVLSIGNFGYFLCTFFVCEFFPLLTHLFGGISQHTPSVSWLWPPLSAQFPQSCTPEHPLPHSTDIEIPSGSTPEGTSICCPPSCLILG